MTVERPDIRPAACTCNWWTPLNGPNKGIPQRQLNPRNDCPVAEHNTYSGPYPDECALGCGETLTPYGDGVWKEVKGFVGGPHKDSMCLREDTGRFAHDACIQKVKAGQAADQPSIFGE